MKTIGIKLSGLVLLLLLSSSTLRAQNEPSVTQTVRDTGSVAVTTVEEEPYITLNGVVKNQQNKKRLGYVNISVPGTTIGTVTNEDGEFTLKIKNSLHAKEISISHLGYANNHIALAGGDKNDLTVWMTPYKYLLDEVVVHGNHPRDIVEQAISKIEKNYNSKNSMLTGFYRETARKGRRFINISEAVIDIFKTAYTNRTISYDRVQVLKGRSLLSQKGSDTLGVKLLGGPNLSVYTDVVKNPDVMLDMESLPYYDFQLESYTTINKRPQYVISFRPQAVLPYALYYGRLYIDQQRLSFTRAEFSLDMSDKNKATEAILQKKPFGLVFKPQEVSFFVNYKDRDGKTYLSYIRNEVRFKCDWKKKLFSTSYTIQAEMVVTDSRNGNVERIPYKSSFRSKESLSDNVAFFYDEDFWGGYNIIAPTESLENAVSKLKKQHRK